MNLEKEYKDKRVLITGGMGFIGSNLAEKLVEKGARVSILDSNLANHGANLFNIEKIEKRLEEISFSDIRDEKSVLNQIKGREIIFNLAAHIGHTSALKNPGEDVSINLGGHLRILELCRKFNPRCRILFPGSRTEYGKIKKEDLPVKENHPLNPINKDIYALSKTAGESYYRNYNQEYGLDTLVLRITNPFGPRAQIKHPGYCIVNWFIRQVLEEKPIKIYGEGSQLRDYVYIDDVVDAFLIAGVHPMSRERIYNVGSGVGTRFGDMAEEIVEIIGKGEIIKNIPYPEDYQSLETGDFYADISRIQRELNWKPRISLREGLKKTIEFYQRNLKRYV